MSPKLENRKAGNLAYIEYEGPYGNIPWEDLVKRLYGWAKEQKVMPGFYPMAIYHNEQGKKRSEIAITFKGKAKGHAGIRTRKTPAMKMATISHKGPGRELKNTYGELTEWIDKKGYKISGPTVEIYSKRPEVVDGVTILYVKVMMPVKKK